MEFIKTKLEGVVLIKPDTFEDFRGTYTETYNRDLYGKNGVPQDFVVDDYSTSSKHVLRGLHGDNKTWKLIDCMHGKFYFVVLNVIEKSSQYGEWESFTISDSNHWQVLVPPGFANGHLALTDKIIFHYKQSEYYDPDAQFTHKWNDPKFNIWWPVKDPITSKRDEGF